MPVAAEPRKLDPVLVPLATGSDQAKILDVSVLLKDASATTLLQLKQLGFEQLKPIGKDLVVTGRIAAGKLSALSEIAAVRYVVAVPALH
jgi:hypothetical protein